MSNLRAKASLGGFSADFSRWISTNFRPLAGASHSTLIHQSDLSELSVQLPAPALPAKGALPEDAGRLGHLRVTPPARLAVGLAENTAAPSFPAEKGT